MEEDRFWGGSVLVSGQITARQRTRLIVVEVNLNGQRYRDEIIGPVVLPFWSRHGPAVRLHDFVIEVYRTNPSRCSTAAPAVCKRYAGVFGSMENVVCDNAVSGRFVRIWKPSTLTTEDILTVCEVEVYGIKPGSRCPSVRYQRVNGKRLNAPGVTSFPEQLRTSCVSLCLMSETCVGVNYNGRTKACELISRPQPTDTVSLIQDSAFYGDDLC
ncbi:uncharacterized protein [Haliotis cracherodii]|uniref:uncharacterized protein n=1 Tax=Haliotis cracherodii TaxID=6455 RepID=UPI0039E962FF